MVVIPPVPFAPLLLPREPSKIDCADGPLSFGEWLLAQAERPGILGELAKTAKQDRAFPKSGTADAIRARFSAVGADGDAFEALDDAEREFDRATW